MAKITLDVEETMSYLVSLLKILAEAIGWVCHQKKKITIEVPDEYAKKAIAGGSCLLWAPPPGSTEAEILIGILKTMREKGDRRPELKRRK